MSARWRDAWPRWLALLVFALLLIPHLGFIQTWDTELYYQCLERFTSSRGLMDVCSGHWNPTYYLPLVLAQALAPGNAWLLNAVSAAVGGAAIVGFHRVVRAAGLGGDPWEEALLTGLFAAAPAFLAYLIDMSPDFFVTAYLMVYVACLLARRQAAAMVVGILLSFAKESGACLAVVATVAYALAHEGRPTTSIGRWLKSLRPALVRLLPPLGYAVLLVLVILPHRTRRFITDSVGGIAVQGSALDFNLHDPLFKAYLANVFVLNFAWIMSLAVALRAALALLRRLALATPPPRGATPAATERLLALLLVGAIYVVTRIRPWNDARYVLPVLPILILSGAAALRALVPKAWARRTLLALTLLLTVLANFRTLDPVSRWFYGTYAFGDHELLAMGSVEGYPSVRFDDEVIYNLEYTWIGYLEDEAFAAIKPDQETLIVADQGNCYFNPGVLDPTTFARVRRPDGVVAPRMRCADPRRLGALLAGEPPFRRLFFLSFPHFAGDDVLGELRRRYPQVARRSIAAMGYRLDLTEFAVQNPAE